uniref:COX assembly mitochondrial protein n=1 Tax=Noctiluca scintillans TaxID=2966 RepID=A7WQ62_NOCSC|nr:conserved hypothetical protein [Noctiluca scintillans]
MFFVDPPFKPTKEVPSDKMEASPAPEVSSKAAEVPQKPVLDDLPVDLETVDKMRNSRVPYLEAREAVELEQKEYKAARDVLGAEIRELCRPEIDEYVDCCVGRLWSIWTCKPKAFQMSRCIKRHEEPEFVDRRMKEIMSEREARGESILNNTSKGATRERRALYNRAIASSVDDPNELLIKSSVPPAAR